MRPESGGAHAAPMASASAATAADFVIETRDPSDPGMCVDYERSGMTARLLDTHFHFHLVVPEAGGNEDDAAAVPYTIHYVSRSAVPRP